MLYIYQMSNTASGMVLQPDPQNLLVVVVVEDVQYTFASQLNIPLPSFQGREARISYEHPGQLNSSKAFQGTLQEGQLNITLNDGVQITAAIEPPLDIGPVVGSGRWEAS
jgi:hypothetical protein